MELSSIGDGTQAENMKMKYLLCVTSLAFSMVHTPVVAQVYKWTDAQGKVHYSDRASDGSGGRSTEIKVDAPSTVVVAAPVKDWRAQEAEFQKRKPAATTPERYVPRASTKDTIPVNHTSDLESYKRCELARNVMSGKPELNHRTPNAPQDYKSAMREANAICGKQRE